LCDMEQAAIDIAQDPYLQVDGVSYIFPSRIRIAVTERKEVAGIIGLDYNVVIDRNGYVLAMGAGVDLSRLIQVTGVNMAGFQLGERLGEGDDFSTAMLVNLIAALESYDLVQEIVSIDLTTPLAITMRARNGLMLFIGQPTDLDGKMASLRRLLPVFLSQSISVGTLYLSAKGGTVYSPTSDGARLPIMEEQEPEYDDDGNPIIPLEDSADAGVIPAMPTPPPAIGGDDPFSG